MNPTQLKPIKTENNQCPEKPVRRHTFNALLGAVTGGAGNKMKDTSTKLALSTLFGKASLSAGGLWAGRAGLCLTLLFASCSEGETPSNAANSHSTTPTRPTGHSKKALEIAEAEFAKVALRKGEDVVVLDFQVADLENFDGEKVGDQSQILTWISMTHGPDGGGTEGMQKQLLNPFQAMLGELQGGQTAAESMLASMQAAWTRAGIMPRVIHTAAWMQFTGVRHKMEATPLTEADRRNGINWKGLVTFVYGASRYCPRIGDIGDTFDGKSWTEWEDATPGKAGILKVNLTLRDKKWEIVTNPAIGPSDVLEGANTVDVEVAGVMNLFGMVAPDLEKRVTAKAVRTDAGLSSGRYLTKPRSGDLPN